MDLIFTNEWWQGSFLCGGDVIEVGKGGVECVGGCNQGAWARAGLGGQKSQKLSHMDSVFANK
jgi:hypothetical protein